MSRPLTEKIKSLGIRNYSRKMAGGNLISGHIYKVSLFHWNAKGSKKGKKGKKGKNSSLFASFALFAFFASPLPFTIRSDLENVSRHQGGNAEIMKLKAQIFFGGRGSS
jgi:hypothetical protein